jgi:hypothetical protein
MYLVVILVHFSRFGMLHQEKSGNPARQQSCCSEGLREMTERETKFEKV